MAHLQLEVSVQYSFICNLLNEIIKKYILVLCCITLYCMFGLMERDRMDSYIVWIASNGSEYCGHSFFCNADLYIVVKYM